MNRHQRLLLYQLPVVEHQVRRYFNSDRRFVAAAVFDAVEWKFV